MKLIFCGVRGTSAEIQPEYSRFGGDTTCLLVEGANQEKIIIDAGTGIRNASRRLSKIKGHKSHLLLLFTHYHLDHIMGLPSCSFLYDKKWRFEIAAPVRGRFAVEDIVSRILEKPFWPLQVGTMPAKIRFINLPPNNAAGPFKFGRIEVRWCPLHHSEGCTAYRFDEPATGASFVFATDVEWAQSTMKEKAQFLRLCTEPSPAQVLIFDGQFNRRNYPEHKGWGHSTVEEAVAIARHIGVRRLYVTHHAPGIDDLQLQKTETRLIKQMPAARLAREGLEVTVQA